MNIKFFFLFFITFQLNAKAVNFLFGIRDYSFYSANSLNAIEQTFVVNATNSDDISIIREMLSLNREERVPVSFEIAEGDDEINRNYGQPGFPKWNWHVANIHQLPYYDLNGSEYSTHNESDSPSDISLNPKDWINKYGKYYNPTRFVVLMEVDETQPSRLENISARGYAGSDSKTLITGFVISGKTPKNVVIRVLGPSLKALGVQDTLDDPQFTLYKDNRPLIMNDNVFYDSALVPLPKNVSDQFITLAPDLIPSDAREAAVLLNLLPGAYTIHALGKNGSSGVVLTEVYDLDARATPSLP